MHIWVSVCDTSGEPMEVGQKVKFLERERLKSCSNQTLYGGKLNLPPVVHELTLTVCDGNSTIFEEVSLISLDLFGLSSL
jgi:hypothetical protein